MPPLVGAQSLNHRTIREIPILITPAALLLLQCPQTPSPTPSSLGTCSAHCRECQPLPCCFPSPGLSPQQQPPHHLEGPLPAASGQNFLHPVVKNGRGQARQDKAGPWVLPAVMMSDRADTEADLGTRPPLGEVLDFSGAESLGLPRRRPRPASRARGVECRAPVLLLRRRAWLRAAVSAVRDNRVGG